MFFRSQREGYRKRIASSYGNPLATLANNLNLQTVATVSIPAGAMGPNGELIVATYWLNSTSGADESDYFLMVGADAIGASFLTDSSFDAFEVRLKNQNSQASQLRLEGSAFGFGPPTNSLVNFAVAVSMTIQGRKRTNAADLIEFYGYSVDVIWRP